MNKNRRLLHGQGGRSYQYDIAFMRQVVQEYLTGSEGYEKLARRINISASSIREWVLKFSSDLGDQLIVSPPMSEQEQQEVEALKKKQKELEKQLELANMKIFGLQTLIDVAEDVLKIDIRKKSGSKQSPK